MGTTERTRNPTSQVEKRRKGKREAKGDEDGR